MSVLGLDLEYTVKYNPLPSGVPLVLRPRELLQAKGYIPRLVLIRIQYNTIQGKDVLIISQ